MPCRDYEEPIARKASDLVTQNNHLAALLCKACGLLAIGDTVLSDDLQEWYNNHLTADRAAAVAQVNNGELKALTVKDLSSICELTGFTLPDLVTSILGYIKPHDENLLIDYILRCSLEDFIAYQEIIEEAL